MESTKLVSKLIYDRLHRFLHAWIGISIFLLLVTGFYASSTENTFNKMVAWKFHLHMGYLLVWGLLARVIWGLFGTHYARWSELLHTKTMVGCNFVENSSCQVGLGAPSFGITVVLFILFLTSIYDYHRSFSCWDLLQ